MSRATVELLSEDVLTFELRHCECWRGMMIDAFMQRLSINVPVCRLSCLVSNALIVLRYDLAVKCFALDPVTQKCS